MGIHKLRSGNELLLADNYIALKIDHSVLLGFHLQNIHLLVKDTSGQQPLYPSFGLYITEAYRIVLLKAPSDFLR
ncbi:hypothetical protein D3C80_1007960 [compost metagenome]